MRWLSIGVLVISVLMLALAGMARSSHVDLQRQVADTERAFAATLAARDWTAFSGFVADEAVFFAGERAVRGHAAIVEVWRTCFEGERAPLSWAPDSVEVVESGTLATTGGVLRDAAGKPIGRYDAVWRLAAPGRWQIVFERGQPPCRTRAHG